jgi:DnaJ like chaperone protein
VDPLSWLGLRKPRAANANLAAIHERVQGLLPDDEPAVLRYIVVVAALATRIIHADGRVLQIELERLRTLFQHVDRMPEEGIDELCDLLNERAPKLTPVELELCFKELRALCNSEERRGVLRLLALQASADGEIHPNEHAVLVEIAAALGVEASEVAILEAAALRESTLPTAPISLSPAGPDH